MKFTYTVGNPPYQQESEKKSDINGQTRRKNIFQVFQMQVDKVTKKTSVLIYPGARWIHQSGKGVEQFGKDQINDVMLSKLRYYPYANEVFANSGITDGISIVVKNHEKNEEGFEYSYVVDGVIDEIKVENPGEDLLPLNPKDHVILKKVDHFVKKYDLQYMHDRILPQKLFGIESDFVSKNPDKVKLYDYKMEGTISDDYVKILANDKAGAAGRSKWFVGSSNLIKQSKEFIKQWQVVVSSAHPGGQSGRDNQIEIIDDHSVFGRSRVALGSFMTKKEAENFYKYNCSKIIKYTFLMTDEALTSLGKKVPDLIDYSSNGIIDFSRSIDDQLEFLVGITEEEKNHIQKTLDNTRGA